MLGDATGALEVPRVAHDERCFEALLFHDGVGFLDVFFGGLRVFFDVDLVGEDAIF